MTNDNELLALLIRALPTVEHMYHTTPDEDGSLWDDVEAIRAAVASHQAKSRRATFSGCVVDAMLKPGPYPSGHATFDSWSRANCYADGWNDCRDRWRAAK